jgi:FtsH-binding integral membrane protein
MSTTYRYEKVSAPGRTFLSGVFEWMGMGLGITSLVAYLFYATPSLLALLINEKSITGLGYIIMFAPIVFVLIMSFGFNRLSSVALAILFLAYSALMGASLSFIFLVYTSESIAKIFLIAALMYGAMGLIGYTTKTDLTKLGNILLMALVGIIIASVVNIFFRSDSTSYVISFLSVLIFCGLTAWDIQKLKKISAENSPDEEGKSKLGILGALTLYLDFINLFLSLLRIFGNRKE